MLNDYDNDDDDDYDYDDDDAIAKQVSNYAVALVSPDV